MEIGYLEQNRMKKMKLPSVELDNATGNGWRAIGQGSEARTREGKELIKIQICLNHELLQDNPNSVERHCFVFFNKKKNFKQRFDLD